MSRSAIDFSGPWALSPILNACWSSGNLPANISKNALLCSGLRILFFINKDIWISNSWAFSVVSNPPFVLPLSNGLIVWSLNLARRRNASVAIDSKAVPLYVSFTDAFNASKYASSFPPLPTLFAIILSLKIFVWLSNVLTKRLLNFETSFTWSASKSDICCFNWSCFSRFVVVSNCLFNELICFWYINSVASDWAFIISKLFAPIAAIFAASVLPEFPLLCASDNFANSLCVLWVALVIICVLILNGSFAKSSPFGPMIDLKSPWIWTVYLVLPSWIPICSAIPAAWSVVKTPSDTYVDSCNAKSDAACFDPNCFMFSTKPLAIPFPISDCKNVSPNIEPALWTSLYAPKAPRSLLLSIICEAPTAPVIFPTSSIFCVVPDVAFTNSTCFFALCSKFLFQK